VVDVVVVIVGAVVVVVVTSVDVVEDDDVVVGVVVVVVVDTPDTHSMSTFLPADNSRTQAEPVKVVPLPKSSRALGAVMKA